MIEEKTGVITKEMMVGEEKEVEGWIDEDGILSVGSIYCCFPIMKMNVKDKNKFFIFPLSGACIPNTARVGRVKFRPLSELGLSDNDIEYAKMRYKLHMEKIWRGFKSNSS